MKFGGEMGDGLIKVDQNFRNQQIALLRACQFDHGANDIVIGRTGTCGDGFGVIEPFVPPPAPEPVNLAGNCP